MDHFFLMKSFFSYMILKTWKLFFMIVIFVTGIICIWFTAKRFSSGDDDYILTWQPKNPHIWNRYATGSSDMEDRTSIICSPFVTRSLAICTGVTVPCAKASYFGLYFNFCISTLTTFCMFTDQRGRWCHCWSKASVSFEEEET